MLHVTLGTAHHTLTGRRVAVTQARADDPGRVARLRQERAALQRQATCKLLQGRFYNTDTHTVYTTRHTSPLSRLNALMRTGSPEVRVHVRGVKGEPQLVQVSHDPLVTEGFPENAAFVSVTVTEPRNVPEHALRTNKQVI